MSDLRVADMPHRIGRGAHDIDQLHCAKHQSAPFKDSGHLRNRQSLTDRIPPLVDYKRVKITRLRMTGRLVLQFGKIRKAHHGFRANRCDGQCSPVSRTLIINVQVLI